MIDPTVRLAGTADLAEVALLEATARSALVHQRGGERWLATRPPHQGLAPEGGRVWVGTIDGVVVGYLVCDLADDVARVLDVFVLPEAREVGFGDELLAAAVAAARERGATVIEAEALPGDRETKNLYERAGIKARLITVSAPL
ncbi:MAG: GNAT family N-acetyltransferase [Acidimicrobiia bacterium]